MKPFNAGLYNDLALGVDIGFKYVSKNNGMYPHSKDIIMSYKLNGEQKYVFILTSCNFGTMPLWYRVNQTIIVKESLFNHPIYSTIGKAVPFGCIVD